jgi:hypothetical protein
VTSGGALSRKRAALALMLGAGLVLAVELASARWMAALDGPGGMVLAVWHGQVGVGRDPASAYRGLSLRRHSAEFGWWFWNYRHPFVHIFYTPLWLPAAALAAPAGWLWWRGSRRAGRCRRCGYDLSGLPVTAACPECGRAQS